MLPGTVAFIRANNERTLVHTCTVQRRTSASTNPYGEPVYGEFANHLTAQECRFWSEQAGGEQTAELREITRYTHWLALPFGTDITEDDQVINVENALEDTLHAGPLQVVALTKSDIQIIAELREIR